MSRPDQAPVRTARTPVRTPGWFAPLHRVLAEARADQLSRFSPPPGHHRRSAVLLLFGEGRAGVDVLLTERSPSLRSHAGQVSFPGGRLDPEDDGPIAAALREAVEETGLDVEGVQVQGCLPDLYLPPSDYAVTPVMAWWHHPSPVRVVDEAEVARVVRVPVAELVDPANRFLVSHPSGFVGPGFAVRELFVWGFTAGILDRVIQLAGWERPWDASRVEPVPALPEPAQVDTIEAGGQA
ncbi:MAG: CoA pyrophosphatase [Kineosporiaceae bacterium]|nr:CoA pyrophosphatase [Kineosporiaceae bacterium]